MAHISHTAYMRALEKEIRRYERELASMQRALSHARSVEGEIETASMHKRKTNSGVAGASAEPRR